MLLEEMIKFVKHIFNILGNDKLLPKKILVHELQRSGFC
jgi:hypothetical protein